MFLAASLPKNGRGKLANFFCLDRNAGVKRYITENGVPLINYFFNRGRSDGFPYLSLHVSEARPSQRDERKMPLRAGRNAMMPQNLRYMESHEWARQEEDVVTVGITDYAQAEIQDIVYVELPEVGTHVTQKTEFGVIESVKAAFDLYAPVSGEVIAVNDSLVDAPEHVNTSPYDAGWLIKISMTDSTELAVLLDAETYRAHTEADN